MKLEKLLIIALESSKKAGIEVAKHYKRGDYTSEIKEDNSPVTSADIAANDILMAELSRLTPNIPIISEEVGALPLKDRKAWSRYWLLDPIDGTGEFIIGSGDFAVNVALVENGWPVIGVIHAPDHQLTYYAQKGAGAFKESEQGCQQITVKPYDGKRKINVAVSRRQKLSLMGQYLNDTFDLYRFFDATIQTEFFYSCVEETISKALPAEVEYLQKYDLMKSFISQYIDMPDNTADLLVRFLNQNEGKLSKRAREKEFSALTNAEIKVFESKYEEVFGG